MEVTLICTLAWCLVTAILALGRNTTFIWIVLSISILTTCSTHTVEETNTIKQEKYLNDKAF